MNPKNTWLLVLVTAGLFAFIFFFERHLHKPPPPSPYVLPNFNTNAVSSVKIALAGQLEIMAVRTNGGWQLVKPLVYPARAEAVENLLQAVTDLTFKTRIPAEVLKDRRSLNEEYGFNKPQATLIFQVGDEERQLTLGNLTAPGNEIYAQVVSQDHVDILDVDFFRNFIPPGANDWRDTTFLNFPAVPFDRLTVTYGTQMAFELMCEKTNQFWHMNKPVHTRADYPKVNDLLQKLINLQVSQFVNDDPHADLEGFGLQPPALDLQFNSGTNAVLDVQFGKSPTNAPTLVYARCTGQNSIVQVPREFITAWQAGFQEFRDRHLVRFTGGSPDVIEVSNMDEEFTLERQTNGEWHVTQPHPFVADTNIMQAFLTGLTNLEVVRSNGDVAVKDTVLADTDFPTYGLDKPARRYLIKRNTPAGASNALIAELDFGLKDGKVFARRADRPEETSVYAVSQGDFDKLPGHSMQLRDHHIWNFTEDVVASITVRQRGKTQKLIHLGPYHWMIAPGSQGLINESQVEIGADELGLLEAENWIESGDDNRAKYGFSPNSIEISVDTKTAGKPLQTFTLDLGGNSPRGLRYGDVKMPDGQHWIFELPAMVWDRLSAYFNLSDNPAP